ncbi:MAG: hypothetical protein KatS3mg007_2395 [Thermoanaerobaculum sp.]|nr:MAG: hypothetical protein KatS3mg007_2395 [Thermoanaerobaculum sp.]
MWGRRSAAANRKKDLRRSAGPTFGTRVPHSQGVGNAEALGMLLGICFALKTARSCHWRRGGDSPATALSHKVGVGSLRRTVAASCSPVFSAPQLFNAGGRAQPHRHPRALPPEPPPLRPAKPAFAWPTRGVANPVPRATTHPVGGSPAAASALDSAVCGQLAGADRGRPPVFSVPRNSTRGVAHTPLSAYFAWCLEFFPLELRCRASQRQVLAERGGFTGDGLVA